MSSDIEKETKEKLLNLFKRFNPTSIWSKCSSHDDFTIKHLGLGFVAVPILCRLTDEYLRREQKNFPNDSMIAVVIKYNAFDNVWIEGICSRFEISIILSVIGQSGLGPAMIYTDEECNVFEYIEGRDFAYEDDFDPVIIRMLAENIAQFHSLRVPVSNRGYIAYFKCYDFETMPDREIFFNKEYIPLIEKDEKLSEKYLDFVRQAEPVEELKWILPLMKAVGSPMVFSHNDYNRRNRRITADGSKLLMLDFDFSNYNARGMDLGRYFSNYHHHDDMFGDEGFPTDEEMVEFLEAYRQEWARLNGGPSVLEKEINSMDQLRRESKIYTLFGYFIDYHFCLWMFVKNPNDPEADYFLRSALQRWQGINRLKKLFIEDGTISYITKNPRQ